MAHICVMGAGVCGMGAAMLLARDGHEITMIERDADDVPHSLDDAWGAWERGGVPQFRQPHNLHARVRHILEAELPDVLGGLRADGAFRLDPLAAMPPFITDHSSRPDDEKFWTLTGRRPMVESVFAKAIREEQRIELTRGERVLGLATGREVLAGVPHVVGVETGTRGTVRADLVVDATGRRSPLPEWIAAAGGRRPLEEAERYQFAYYSRFFRSRISGLPRTVAPVLSEFPTYSILTLPGDNDHWSVTVIGSSADQPMKRLRDLSRWTAVLAAHPLHRHWIDGEPISDVLAIAGTMDRYRSFVIDGAPVATGVAAVADAWACTNPSAGRGISVGLMHALLLRDAVREHLEAPARLAEALHHLTEREVMPWYRMQVETDRARVAAIDAAREGRTPSGAGGVRDDPMRALRDAAPFDADAFRAFIETVTCLALPEEIFARPGFAQHVQDAARGREGIAVPGPSREELLSLLA